MTALDVDAMLTEEGPAAVQTELDRLRAALARVEALLAEAETEADCIPRDTATVKAWEVRAVIADTLDHDALGRRVIRD